jgi:hypothetical protein
VRERTGGGGGGLRNYRGDHGELPGEVSTAWCGTAKLPEQEEGDLGGKRRGFLFFFFLIFPWALFVIGLCVSYGIAGGTLLDLGRKRIRFNPRSAGWPSFTSFTVLLYYIKKKR